MKRTTVQVPDSSLLGELIQKKLPALLLLTDLK